jgi:hypothetical protein
MLLIIAGILVILWLVGLLANIGGGLIHILLVIALVLFIYHMLTGRKAV